MKYLASSIISLVISGSAFGAPIEPENSAFAMSVTSVTAKAAHAEHGSVEYEIYVGATFGNSCEAPLDGETLVAMKRDTESPEISMLKLNARRACPRIYRPVTKLFKLPFKTQDLSVSVNGVSAEFDHTDLGFVADYELTYQDVARFTRVDSVKFHLVPDFHIIPHGAPTVGLRGVVTVESTYSNSCHAPSASELVRVVNRSDSNLAITLLELPSRFMCPAVYNPVTVSIEVFDGPIYEQQTATVNGVTAN